MITFTFDLNWPELIETIFSRLSFVGESSEFIFSFDCILFSTEPLAQPYFLKSLMYTCFPGAAILTSYGLWWLVSCIKKSFRAKYVLYATVTVMVNMFLLYPLIINTLFNMITCQQVDGISYLKRELSIKCWSTEHVQWAAALCTINIGWLFGFPAIVFRQLYKHAQKQ